MGTNKNADGEREDSGMPECQRDKAKTYASSLAEDFISPGPIAQRIPPSLYSWRFVEIRG
jgi:hypothetical protein